MSIKVLLILSIISISGLAQENRGIRGPVSGFLYDQPTRAVRPILGVPGSAYLGPALITEADAGSIAPDGSTALAVQQGRLFVATDLESLAAQWTPVEGAIADIDLFAWSEGSVAVYSSKSGQAQIVRSVAKSATASAPMDFSVRQASDQSTGLRPVVLALSKDAVLAAVNAADGGGIYIVSAGQTTRLVAAAQNVSALALEGADLFFTDRDSGSVWRVRNFASGPAPEVFAAGIDAPAGLQIMSGKLMVSSAGARQLQVFDLESRSLLNTFDLDFTPDTLESAGGSSRLLLARGVAGQQPYYFVDAARDPAFFFVPAGRDEQ